MLREAGTVYTSIVFGCVRVSVYIRAKNAKPLMIYRCNLAVNKRVCDGELEK